MTTIKLMMANMKNIILAMPFLLMACKEKNGNKIETEKSHPNIQVDCVANNVDSSGNLMIQKLRDIGANPEIDSLTSDEEMQIEKFCDTVVLYLKHVKYDRENSDSLISLFVQEQKEYQNELLTETRILLTSFNSRIHVSEASYVSNAYYYLKLKSKYCFLRKIFENIKQNY